ncbi:MAG TPA: flagellar biosynthesis anti-sigma factor FlgM [Burkholderiales bacterium]|nr:flagellar biosynthesis anti-sigma factor FlgM [Burkholderiales bacterium]
MKIDNSLKSVGNLPGEAASAKNGKAETAKPQSGVSVDISGVSSQLQALGAQGSGSEVVDAARVSEIKQAISEGRFQVNPDVVADRLLQTVHELITAYKR